jgi:hypothetical protein
MTKTRRNGCHYGRDGGGIRVFLAVALLAVAVPAHAGIVGWATTQSRSWEYIQQTGGIRIGSPMARDGKAVLPVEYDVSGLSTITCKPAVQNSGLAVRRVELKRKDTQLVLQVYSQLAENGGATGTRHYVDLSGIPAGRYEVFYGVAGDPGSRLGQIEIR